MAQKKTADPTETAIEALTRALTNSTPLRLHGTKANPGIFVGSSQKLKDAASLCLEKGWLTGTGERVGKGKSAKETFRITKSGIAYALEHGQVASLLKELLFASDSQQETLQQLQQLLQNASQAMRAQNEALSRLQEKVKTPPIVAAPDTTKTSRSATDDRWLHRVVEYVMKYRQANPHRSCSFADLFKAIVEPAGVSIGEFHDGLRQLSRERKISLRPWTGAMSDLDDDHLALVLAKETKFYADPTS